MAGAEVWDIGKKEREGRSVVTTGQNWDSWVFACRYLGYVEDRGFTLCIKTENEPHNQSLPVTIPLSALSLVCLILAEVWATGALAGPWCLGRSLFPFCACIPNPALPRRRTSERRSCTTKIVVADNFPHCIKLKRVTVFYLPQLLIGYFLSGVGLGTVCIT